MGDEKSYLAVADTQSAILAQANYADKREPLTAEVLAVELGRPRFRRDRRRGYGSADFWSALGGLLSYRMSEARQVVAESFEGAPERQLLPWDACRVELPRL